MDKEFEKLEDISLLESAGYNAEFIQMLLDSFYDDEKYHFNSTDELMEWLNSEDD